MNGLTFGRNIGALRAERHHNNAAREISTTFQRLSSGLRINSPSDDPAGLGLASILSVQRKILTQGIRNLNDGISALNIADASIGQLSSIIERQRELAMQAANGSLTSTQRAALDNEFQALAQEHQRIISSTSFNGNQLINGALPSLSIQAGGDALRLNVLGYGSTAQGTGTYSNITTQMQVVSPGGEFQLIVHDINSDGIDDVLAVALEATGVDILITAYAVFGGTYDLKTITKGEAVDDPTGISGFGISVSDAGLHVDGTDGGGTSFGGTFELLSNGFGDYTSTGGGTPWEGSTVLVGDFNGDGLDDEADASAGSSFSINEQDATYVTSLESLSQSALSITSISNAHAAMTSLDSLLTKTQRAQGVVGASLSRIASATAAVSSREARYAEAESRVRDADIAAEVARLTRLQIIEQTSVAVLAQANQQGQVVLGLLSPT